MKKNLIVAGLVGAVAMTLLAAPAHARVSASQKGSLLIYSKVEIRWDAAGNLIQDTFLDITNDFPGDVCVQMYFINGDEPLDAAIDTNGVLIERFHPGWNNVDVGICLTQNQPTYWSAATGYAGADGIPVSPFTILDPGTPKGRPDYIEGSSDRILRGYVIAWAVNGIGQEIRWNHLKGDAVIVNYSRGTAWEYNAWAFASVAAVANGAAHANPGWMQIGPPAPGAVDNNGVAIVQDYEEGFDFLLLDFYAVGTSAFSGPVGVTVDTDLTLFPVSADLRQETDGPVTTKASFTIWNQNETKLTGLDRCVTCWDQTLLSLYGVPNHFLNLQTDKGKAQIDGIPSQLCDFDYDLGDQLPLGADPRDVVSTAASLLGVVAKHLSFSSGDYAVAGMNLVGTGTQSAAIEADLQGVTPPEHGEGQNPTKEPTRMPVTTPTRALGL